MARGYAPARGQFGRSTLRSDHSLALVSYGYEMHPGERVPRKWKFAGPDWSDPSKYLLSTVRRDDGGIIEDNTYGGRFDATWRLDKVAGGSGFLTARQSRP